MFGRHPDGTETLAAMDLVRFAIPSRTYTQSHVDYVIEVVRRVAGRAPTPPEYRIVDEMPALRHFTARFAALAQPGRSADAPVATRWEPAYREAMGSALARFGSRKRAPRRGGGREGAPCTPEFDIAANPATIGTLMRGADAGTRERLATALQRRHGNAAVQRLLAPANALPLQRWTVALPAATTDCGRVVSYLDANSPHRATSGWARTHVRFSWGGSPAYSESGGVITATVASPTVTKTASVDMPTWAPTDPAMSRAWGAMSGSLRTHEGRHEAIATTWEATLRSRLSGLSLTVADRKLATFRAAVQAEWNGWLAEHQADQTAIDPFTAMLDCSEVGSETEADEAPGVEGVVGAAEGS